MQVCCGEVVILAQMGVQCPDERGKGMRKFIRAYGLEIIALFVVLLGGFFLVDRWDIRGAIIRIAADVIQGLPLVVNKWMNSFNHLSTSDILGGLLVILAGLFLLWRIRNRFLKSGHWLGTTCPRCGEPIHRIHRTRFDRFLGIVLLPEARRYQCVGEECGWIGRRRRGRRRFSKEHTAVI